MWAAEAFRLAFSPAGRVVLALLSLVLWTAYQRHDAAHDEIDRLTAQFERDKAVEVARQRAVALAAVEAANQRARQAETKLLELQDAAESIKADLERAGAQCPLDDTLRDRLRAIR